MKIVCTSDTHFPFDPDMVPRGDVLIHAGDLMYKGTPDEWYPVLESLKKAGEGFKERIFLPGNHDFHVQNYEGVAVAELRKQAGFRTIGLAKPMTQIGRLKILGVPWVPNLKGWAFCRDEDWIYDWLNGQSETYGSFDIVVSHSPPHGLRDAMIPDTASNPAMRNDSHVGSFGMRRWLNEAKVKPKAWVCGHIHEGYGREVFDGVQVLNVAMCDRDYEQTNTPLVLEVE